MMRYSEKKRVCTCPCPQTLENKGTFKVNRISGQNYIVCFVSNNSFDSVWLKLPKCFEQCQFLDI